MDAERFAGNALAFGSSLRELEHSLGRKLIPAELVSGIQNGAAEAAAYIAARPLRRSLARPTTSIVMSGGAATGAFTAGFLWRVLTALKRCHSGEYEECKDAKIDLAVGTSTGSLAAVIVQLFHVPEREDEPDKLLNEDQALELLVDKFTCSSEAKLYCVNDELVWKIADDVRGLVQFDGIEGYLRETMSKADLTTSPTELVTMAVDYDTGDLFAISDKDPVDAASQEGRIQAVLASIVEPLLADPVDEMTRSNGQSYKGTFIDGGIRSGLPVMEAMHRGAERVLAISTSSLEADPIDHPEDMVRIVLRTVDLMVQQVRVGEVQQAEFTAVSRRMLEHDLCAGRFINATDDVELQRFCRREFMFVPTQGTQGAASLWIGPLSFQQVSNSWQTEWVYRPEEPAIPGATGYSFDPKLMRLLFEQGLKTFHMRCKETLELLGLPLLAIGEECTDDSAATSLTNARGAMPKIETCYSEEKVRQCDQ